MSNQQTPYFDLNIKPLRFKPVDSSLNELNNYMFTKHDDLVSNKAEYYKTMFPVFYNIYNQLHPFIQRKYFRNNHRIFIYWGIHIISCTSLDETLTTFDDIVSLSKKEQDRNIEILCEHIFDSRFITKKQLEKFKKAQIKLITKQITGLKTNFIKGIIKKKLPMQISLPSLNTMIMGGNSIEATKKVISPWVCTGYSIKEKLYTPIVSGSETPMNIYMYVLKKDDKLISTNLN